MVQQTLAVFLVLALLLAALWALRRKGLATYNSLAGFGRVVARKSPRRMRVLERIVLTSQHSLHLVSIEDRLIVFAASPGGCHAVEQSKWSNHPAPAHETDQQAGETSREAATC